MISRSSHVLHALVESGCVTADAARARKFMLDALGSTHLALPDEARSAIDLARRSMQAAVGDAELLDASSRCWSALRSKGCDIPDSLGYAYRVAIGTCSTQAQSEDPWTSLDFFMLCARHLGVSDDHLVEALERNYGRPPNTSLERTRGR